MNWLNNSMPDLRSGVVLEEIKDPKEIWLQSKLGIISASEISAILTYENKPNELPKGAISLCIQKVYEKIFKKRYSDITSDAIEHGAETEPKAVEIMKTMYKIEFQNTGKDQVFFQKFGIGATPDGINETYVLEVKCPQFIAHANHKSIKDNESFKSIAKKYYDQVQTQMLVCEREKALFVSCFHDVESGFFDLHKIEIQADKDYQEFIKLRSELANEEIRRRYNDYID